MRSLMVGGEKDREERGISAVFFALALSILVSGLGLSIDIGNVAYQDTRAQQAADSAARQIAVSCGKDGVGTTGCATGQAGGIVAQTFTGAATGAQISSTDVTVTVDKDIPTSLLGMIGIPSKHVTARAKASWENGHPVEGAPMLPMAIPVCMYQSHLPPSTTPLLLRSDLISVVFNVIVQGGSAGRLITTLLGDLLQVTESCTTPAGVNLKVLRGPIWLSGLEGAVQGAFNWNSSVCNMHLGTIDGFLGASVSAVIPSSCVNKLGTQIKKGQIITLPIYQPSITLQELGLEMDAVVCVLGVCPIQSVKVPPRIGVKVLGFAPFRITGWNFAGNSSPDPNAPACSSITLLTHPPASVGCNGIQGYFVKSMVRDPNFTYHPDGADFGAGSVKLTQ